MAVLPGRQPTRRWQCGTPKRCMQSFASDESTLARYDDVARQLRWIRGDAPHMRLVAMDRTTFDRSPKRERGATWRDRPTERAGGAQFWREGLACVHGRTATAEFRSDRRGRASMGSARLAGPGVGHGRRDLHHAAAADLSRPRRRRPPSAGLTFARYEVLMLLSFSRQGALPLGKIGERLQVNAASVTNAVDRLEADGLVTRRSNPDDGRGRLARLTASWSAECLGRHRGHERAGLRGYRHGALDGRPALRPAGRAPRCRRRLRVRALESSLTLK